MTFAALAQHCKETRYGEAFYDEQGRRLYGVREPKKFASMINRLVSSLGHLKLSDITVNHFQQYRRKRLSIKNKPRHLHGCRDCESRTVYMSRDA
jgi:hypothetical protein